MPDKIRLGVIGTGMAWDKLHWPALKKMPDKYEIAAVCNKTVSKAENFADSIALPRGNVYADYRQMLARDDIDAVDVLVPISENFEAARDVLNAGKHLIAEKPFAGTPEAARELIALKNGKNLKVMVAENCVYDEDTLIIKGLTDGGGLGRAVSFTQAVYADCETSVKGDGYFSKEWRRHPAFPGGVFLDGGIHDIARLRFLFGEIESLCAYGVPHNRDYCPYDTITALMKFKSGVIGTLSYCSSRAERLKPAAGLRISCEKADIYLESKWSGKVVAAHADGHTGELPFTPDYGYTGEFLNFYDALANGAEIISTPETELGDIEAVHEILRSAGES